MIDRYLSRLRRAGTPSRVLWARRRKGSGVLSAILVVAQCLGGWGQVLAADQVPPVIVHDPVETVVSGSEVPIIANVTDEAGVADVQLNLRYPSAEGFKAFPMQSADRIVFSRSMNARESIPGETIDYFITATDNDGNSESRGFEFDPFSVRVIEPAPAPEPEMTVVTPPEPEIAIVTPPEPEPIIEPQLDRTSSGQKILYALGAVVAIGLVAELAGGTGDGSVVVNREVCCQVVVRVEDEQ